MANYPLEQLLSPVDFEHLVKDLLSQDLNIDLTAFSEGSDKGIDLRCFKENKNKIVVQCKRTNSLGRKKLMAERDKLKNLQIEKYYLATSCDTSVEKNEEILDIFGEWMVDESHIYSKNRLNSLLDKHTDIQRKHYKLWINSAEMFNHFVNNDIIGRSTYLWKDITKNLKYYVFNESLSKAVDILKKHHVLIISGIPGIGKTTLARILSWMYCLDDFEVVEIREINEGERILTEEKKQILYFDDFLGENFLEYDSIKGRSQDLHMFMKRVTSCNNKYLIMTTREYILNQALERYEKLDREDIDVTKYTLDLNEYTDRIKALILYNHLYYSDVSHKHIDALLKDKTYLKIIKHKNYNPRIIEVMTIKLKGITAEDYPQEFLSNLDKPIRVWKKAFENQISEASRYVLRILVTMGGAILKDDLESAFYFFLEMSAKKLNLYLSRGTFKESLKELEDSFIETSVTIYNTIKIDFQNPSIKDFLIEEICSDFNVLSAIINSALFFNQITFFSNRKFPQLSKIIIDKLIKDFYKLKSSRLIQWHSSTNSWHRNDFTMLEKLGFIVSHFPFENNIPLKEIVIKELKQIDFKFINHNWDHSRFLTVYEKVKESVGIEPDELIQSYLDSMFAAEHIEDFAGFEKICPIEFYGFIIIHKKKIFEKFNELVDDEEDNSLDNDSFKKIISIMDKIQNDFELDIEDEMETFLHKIEEKQFDPDNEEVDMSANKKLYDDDSFDIESLFNSEMLDK